MVKDLIERLAKDAERHRSCFNREMAVNAEAALGVLSALDWFDAQTNMELYYYRPFYGDDDDQSEEWRVSRVRGSMNDREWKVIGRGKTAIEAIKTAKEENE